MENVYFQFQYFALDRKIWSFLRRGFLKLPRRILFHPSWKPSQAQFEKLPNIFTKNFAHHHTFIFRPFSIFFFPFPSFSSLTSSLEKIFKWRGGGRRNFIQPWMLPNCYLVYRVKTWVCGEDHLEQFMPLGPGLLNKPCDFWLHINTFFFFFFYKICTFFLTHKGGGAEQLRTFPYLGYTCNKLKQTLREQISWFLVHADEVEVGPRHHLPVRHLAHPTARNTSSTTN